MVSASAKLEKTTADSEPNRIVIRFADPSLPQPTEEDLAQATQVIVVRFVSTAGARTQAPVTTMLVNGPSPRLFIGSARRPRQETRLRAQTGQAKRPGLQMALLHGGSTANGDRTVPCRAGPPCRPVAPDAVARF